MSNLVPVTSVREAVRGSGPLTAIITGPASSIGAAVVKVPVETAKGFLVGLKDAVDTTKVETGTFAGSPRWAQNICSIAGGTVIFSGVAACVGWALGVYDPVMAATIGTTAAFCNNAPLEQTLDGVARGARSAIVSGYTFAKSKLGNH